MLKHHISAEVIAALLCFCLGSMCLGVSLLYWQEYNYDSSGLSAIQLEEMIMILLSAALSGLVIISGVGFLRKKRWGAIIMTLLMALMLALVIIAIGFTIKNFINGPAYGPLFLFLVIGLPLFMMLFFSSTVIFPWIEKDKGEEYENLIDQV